MMFGDLNQSITGDFDEDGLNNRDEFLAGTDARVKDTDGDGVGDNQEVTDGTDPKSASSVDSDHDGVLDPDDAVPYDPNFTHPKSGMPHYAIIDLGLGSGFKDMADSGALLWKESTNLLRVWRPGASSATAITWNPATNLGLDAQDVESPVAISNSGKLAGLANQPTEDDSGVRRRYYLYDPASAGSAWLPKPYPSDGDLSLRSSYAEGWLPWPVFGPGDMVHGAVSYGIKQTGNANAIDYWTSFFRLSASTATFEEQALEQVWPPLPSGTPDKPVGYFEKLNPPTNDAARTVDPSYKIGSGTGFVRKSWHWETSVYKEVFSMFGGDSYTYPYWGYSEDHYDPVTKVMTYELATAGTTQVLRTFDLLDDSDYLLANSFQFTTVSPAAQPWVAGTLNAPFPLDDYSDQSWIYKPVNPSGSYQPCPIYASLADYPANPIRHIGLITAQGQAVVWEHYDPANPDADYSLWADGEAKPLSELISGYSDYHDWWLRDVSATGMFAATAMKNSDGKYHMLILMPIEIRGPVVTFNGTMGAEENKTSLRVGKMEHSLNASNDLDIDKDPDYFYLRIDGVNGVNKMSFKIATAENPDASYNDDPTEIEMDSFAGMFYSKKMLLVSDHTADDVYAGNNVGADDQKNDRTHVVQLGGKVRFSDLTIDGKTTAGVFAELNVPVKKEINVQAVILADSGANASMVQQDIKVANERYAQVGVRLKLTGTTNAAVPSDVMSSSDINVTINGTDGGRTLGPEPKALVDRYGTTGSTTDYHLFYVKGIKQTAVGPRAAGFSLPVSLCDGSSGGWTPFSPTVPAYANNLFVATGAGIDEEARRKIFTVAHETGHLLTNEAHYGVDYAEGDEQHKINHSLMRRGTSDGEGIGSTKRLYRWQEKMIHNEDGQ